jgi:hypothetical protein
MPRAACQYMPHTAGLHALQMAWLPHRSVHPFTMILYKTIAAGGRGGGGQPRISRIGTGIFILVHIPGTHQIGSQLDLVTLDRLLLLLKSLKKTARGSLRNSNAKNAYTDSFCDSHKLYTAYIQEAVTVILQQRACACAPVTGTAERESLQRNRPGGLTQYVARTAITVVKTTVDSYHLPKKHTRSDSILIVR